MLSSLGFSTVSLKDSELDWLELDWPLSFFLNSKLSTPKQETSVLGGWKIPVGGGTSLYPLSFLNSGGVEQGDSSSLDVFSSKLMNSSSLVEFSSERLSSLFLVGISYELLSS